MKRKDDIDILQSIRSDDSNQSEQSQKNRNNAKASNKPLLTHLLDDDQEDQIRDTFDFGDSIHYKTNPSKQEKWSGDSQKSDDFSMFNDGTDQIVIEQHHGHKYGQRVVEQRNQIKYPQINLIAEKPSPKKLESEKKLKIPPEPLNLNQINDDQLIDINMSMIGDKPKAFKQKNTKKQELYHETTNFKKQRQAVNPFQSIYLAPRNKVEEKTGIHLKVMDNTMYWVYDNKEIKITSEILEALVEQFFKKQIMLPLINDNQFRSEHISVFMQVYTEFLNQFFPQIFKQIFTDIKSSAQTNFSKFQTGPSTRTPKSGGGLMKNLYENYLPNFLKASGYSKAQLIRNHMTNKLSLLNYLEKIQKAKPEQDRDALLEQKRNQTEFAIAVLQLLVSFENSENYCRDNSKEGIDHKIWKEHGRKIGELRKKWITKIENIKKDFSFKI